MTIGVEATTLDSRVRGNDGMACRASGPFKPTMRTKSTKSTKSTKVIPSFPRKRESSVVDRGVPAR